MRTLPNKFRTLPKLALKARLYGEFFEGLGSSIDSWNRDKSKNLKINPRIKFFKNSSKQNLRQETLNQWHNVCTDHFFTSS